MKLSHSVQSAIVQADTQAFRALELVEKIAATPRPVPIHGVVSKSRASRQFYDLTRSTQEAAHKNLSGAANDATKALEHLSGYKARSVTTPLALAREQFNSAYRSISSRKFDAAIDAIREGRDQLSKIDLKTTDLIEKPPYVHQYGRSTPNMDSWALGFTTAMLAAGAGAWFLMETL